MRCKFFGATSARVVVELDFDEAGLEKSNISDGCEAVMTLGDDADSFPIYSVFRCESISAHDGRFTARFVREAEQM